MSFRPSTASSRGSPPRECNTGIRQHPRNRPPTRPPASAVDRIVQNRVTNGPSDNRARNVYVDSETRFGRSCLRPRDAANAETGTARKRPTCRCWLGLTLCRDDLLHRTFCDQRSTPDGTLAIIRSEPGCSEVVLSAVDRSGVRGDSSISPRAVSAYGGAILASRARPTDRSPPLWPNAAPGADASGTRALPLPDR